MSKRPLAEAQREVGVQIGNFRRKQLQADLTGPLTEDGRWLYRLVAVGRDADTQVDSISDDRVLIAPTLAWRPGAATSWTFQLLHQRDRSGSTLQFPPWSGSGAPNPNGRIPTNRLIGEPGFDYYDSTRTALGWLREQRLNDDWSVRQNLRVSNNEVDFRTFFWAFTDPAYIDGLWGRPIVLGVLIVIGLRSALLADGADDALSWLALGAPLVVAVRHALRRDAGRPRR